MATSASYKDFVLEQLVRCDSEYLGRRFVFSARKLFGEYCVYIADSRESCVDLHLDSPKKVLFLLCDEGVFIKKYESLDAIVRENSEFFTLGYPFDGAREHYIIDIENLALIAQIIQSALPFLPTPKAKPQKSKGK
ncbi:transcriptional regulator [Helicobacter sp. 23-1045]